MTSGTKGSLELLENTRGVAALIIAILSVVLIGFAAFGVDVGHLMVVRNELVNAADAGVLAGARFLYTEQGDGIDQAADQIARDAAVANTSQGAPVQVNIDEVQRGHWSFAGGAFTESDAIGAVDLWDVPFAALDGDPGFVNAIRIVTRMVNPPAASFFARIFGFQGFQVAGTAVAYIGFAGTIGPREADEPLAVCRQSIVRGDGAYTCGAGRMISLGEDAPGHETGAWTDFNQDDPCPGGADGQVVQSLVRSGGDCNVSGNQGAVQMGRLTATDPGEIQGAFDDLFYCWRHGMSDLDTNGDGIPDQRWRLRLPVIECPGYTIGSCQAYRGVVEIDVVWMNGEEDAEYTNVPYRMGDWSSGESDGRTRWNEFVEHFNLEDVDGTSLTWQEQGYKARSLYFVPDCSHHRPVGRTGGDNFGVLARIPVLAR